MNYIIQNQKNEIYCIANNNNNIVTLDLNIIEDDNFDNTKLDFSKFIHLEKLTNLTINNKFEKLNNLQNLQYLSLTSCDIDLNSGFENLNNLKIFNMTFLNLIDAKSLENLYTQKINDDTFYKYFSDLSILSELENLKELHITGGSYSINKLSHIEKLYAFFTSLENQDLSKMKNLKYLYLDSPYIDDLTPIQNCVALQTLILIKPNMPHELKNLDKLSSLENLKELQVVYFNLYDINALNNLKALEKIELNQYESNDFSALYDL